MCAKTRATIEDLYNVEGKAELVNGEILEMPPAGDDPGYARGEIFAALRVHHPHADDLAATREQPAHFLGPTVGHMLLRWQERQQRGSLGQALEVGKRTWKRLHRLTRRFRRHRRAAKGELAPGAQVAFADVRSPLAMPSPCNARCSR